MELSQRLNQIAAEFGLYGANDALLAVAACVLLDRNNAVAIDGRDLPGTLSRLRTAGSSNGVVELEGAANPNAAVQASLSTNLTGANNDLVFTAASAIGADGNDITVAYVNPGANNAVLSVSIVGNAITVSLATNGGGAITTIADDISALNFGGLVTVADKAANDGSGVVTAMAPTALTGGVNAAGDGVAGTGSRYTNYTAGTLWINTGTKNAPTWVQLAPV
jgi:hypothetical protein